MSLSKWENTKDNHPLKEALQKEDAEKIIFMPIFYMLEFKSIL